MERPARIRDAWVMLRIGRQAVLSHKRKKPVYQKNGEAKRALEVRARAQAESEGKDPREAKPDGGSASPGGSTFCRPRGSTSVATRPTHSSSRSCSQERRR